MAPRALGELFLLIMALFLGFLPGNSPSAYAQKLLGDSKLLEDENADPYAKFRNRKSIKLLDFEECAWKVRYRGKVYDLSPLTKRGLDRPLEGDMRPIFRRVPPAAEHINQIERNSHDEKVHTAIATLGLGAFLVTRIFQSRTSDESSKSSKYIALNMVSLLVFVKAVHAGWSLKKDTNQRIALAVEEFNQVSPDKIVPHREKFNEGGL